jgi:Mor family transcriptional regulator
LTADRKLAPLQALEDEMVEAMVRDTGLKPEMARFMVRPILRHLCSEYGGERIYIPSLRAEYPVDEIRAEFANSRDVAGTCRKYSISRRTLYRLLDEAGDEGLCQSLSKVGTTPP